MDETPKKERKRRTRRPRHKLEARAFRFALRPTDPQASRKHDMLDALWGLRNDLTVELSDERKANRLLREQGEAVSYSDRAALYKRVGALTESTEKLRGIHVHLRQNVAVRVVEGTRRWLDALKEGRKGVRPPRPIDRKRYRSFTFPEYGNGCRVQNGRLFLSGVGWVRMIGHRRIVGTKKTVTVKFQHGQWWAIVTAMVQVPDRWAEAREDLPDGGADPGLKSLLTTSHGRVFDPPKPLRDAQKDLKREQHVVSRKFEARKKEHARLVEQCKAEGRKAPALRDVPYSNRLKAQIRVVAKRHTKVSNVRDHHQKKIASICSDTFRRLACEDHPLQFMFRNRRQSKAAAERAIGDFKRTLASTMGPQRFFLTPNSRPGIGGNSQTCLCGHQVPKDLKQREHRCEACGLESDRDHVSANIVHLIAFGTVSPSLYKCVPAGGQPVVRRGGVEGDAGESRSPGAAKAAPQRPRRNAKTPSSSKAAPRVGNLPRKARPVGIRTPVQTGGELPLEPQGRSSQGKPARARREAEGAEQSVLEARSLKGAGGCHSQAKSIMGPSLCGRARLRSC